jgi:hypothetical protein
MLRKVWDYSLADDQFIHHTLKKSNKLVLEYELKIVRGKMISFSFFGDFTNLPQILPFK